MSVYPRMQAVPFAGDPWWQQRAAGCERLTPVCTHMFDCTCHFLVNSRELIGLLLLLACTCILEPLLPSAVRIASIVDLVIVARSNLVAKVTISVAAV